MPASVAVADWFAMSRLAREDHYMATVQAMGGQAQGKHASRLLREIEPED